MPVPTAVPPSGSSPTRGSASRSRSTPSLDLRGVAAELLAERDRRGVHEVGAARLHDRPRTAARLAPQRRGEVLERGEQLDGRSSRTAARWMADGNTSFDDCEAFTWSFGCTGAPEPLRRERWRAPRSCSCSTTCPSRSGTRRPGSGRPSCPRRPRRRRRGSPSATSFGDHLQPGVDRRRRPLDRRPARRSAPARSAARDREVLDRPLRLRPPPGVGRHPDLAHRVVLDAVARIVMARDATRRLCHYGSARDRLRLPGAAARSGPDDTAVPAAHRPTACRPSRPPGAASSRSSPRRSPLLTAAGDARHRPPAAARPPPAAARTSSTTPRRRPTTASSPSTC